MPTSPDAWSTFRDAAVEAAYTAAHTIRRHAGRLDHDAIDHKGTHDLVTAIDAEAQRLIIDVLAERFPDHDILAEEGTYSEGVRGPVDGYRWIIDPIDGTTNFTHGLAPYAVSIGLQYEDDLVAGVVLDVARDELFTAVKGQGLYVNGARARVSRAERMDQSIVSTGFPFREFEHVDAYLEVLREAMVQVQSFRRFGSAAVDLAHIACGRCDGFVQLGLGPWDAAAGIVLVREGGGRVTDFTGAVHTSFQSSTLASNGSLHEALLKLVTRLRHV